MIGILLTGHGNFAPALLSAVEMIAGQQSAVEVVQFTDDLSLEDFEAAVATSLDHLLAENDGVLIFTDLLGGTPFRLSSTITSGREEVEVLTGTNLAMLLEGVLSRLAHSGPVSELAKNLCESGKSGITHTAEILAKGEQEVEASDGI